MGPKSTAGGKSNKGKADDAKSTKSKVSQKRRPPSVAKSQASKAGGADQAEKVKSQKSDRYEEANDDDQYNENIPEPEDGGEIDEILDLQQQTTKGAHLQSELDGQL
jgi:hypothetical protein